jgi:hypothetical protein
MIEAVRDGNVQILGPLAGLLSGETIDLGEGGRTNVIKYENGSLRMISANCPGGDCMRARPISDAGGVIICAPHRLAVRLASAAKPHVDSVSY